MLNDDQKIFIVEGNIGAGKSTLLRLIEHYLNIQVVYEPIERWQHMGNGENILEKFYQDTQRWAYTFQNFVFITRILEQQQKAKHNRYSTQVLERSVYSDRYCFAKNCFEQGSMTQLEWQLYQEWFSWLVKTYCQKPTGFIYMYTDPEICYKRLKIRARQEESLVPLAYLKSLHSKHEQWLIHKKEIDDYVKEVPVLILECNKDFEHDTQEQENHIEKIVTFFNDNSTKIKNHEKKTFLTL